MRTVCRLRVSKVIFHRWNYLWVWFCKRVDLFLNCRLQQQSLYIYYDNLFDKISICCCYSHFVIVILLMQLTYRWFQTEYLETMCHNFGYFGVFAFCISRKYHYQDHPVWNLQVNDRMIFYTTFVSLFLTN